MLLMTGGDINVLFCSRREGLIDLKKNCMLYSSTSGEKSGLATVKRDAHAI